MTAKKEVPVDMVTIEAPEIPVTIYQGTAVIQMAAGVDRDIPRRFLSAAIRAGLNEKAPDGVKPKGKRKVAFVDAEPEVSAEVVPEVPTELNKAE